MGYGFQKILFPVWDWDKIYIYANAQKMYLRLNSDYEGYDPERSTFNSGMWFIQTPNDNSFCINLKF